MKFVVVQGCPVPALLAPFLSELLHETHTTLNSCYRGERAASLLHRLGKRTQRELYAGWLRRLPGYLPANPPGFSTHELRNDGVAYRGKRGGKLGWWQVGIDVDDKNVEKMIVAARKRGWTLARTYSHSQTEYHHLNFRKPPAGRIRAHVAKRKIKTLSTKGAAFIGRFEGFSAVPYNDPAGYATVGYGHLIGKRHVTAADRRRWGRMSRRAGLKLLCQDAEVAAAAVREHVKVPLSQKQFDALVSFTYNVGAGAFAASTLLKKINAKEHTLAALFEEWDMAGGKVLPGLRSRRAAEARLYAGGPYG